MTDPGIITEADVKAIVAKQGLDPIGEGDCVFLHTGHGDIWHPSEWDTFDAAEKQKRGAAFNAGEPGFGLSGREYLASRKIILWGRTLGRRKPSAKDSAAKTNSRSNVTSR